MHQKPILSHILAIAVVLALLAPELILGIHAIHHHDHDEPCQICVELSTLIATKPHLAEAVCTLVLVLFFSIAPVFKGTPNPFLLPKTLVSLNMKLND